MTKLEQRLQKLEQKKDDKKKGIYPNGCTKCEIVGEWPDKLDPDTFYIELV